MKPPKSEVRLCERLLFFQVARGNNCISLSMKLESLEHSNIWEPQQPERSTQTCLGHDIVIGQLAAVSHVDLLLFCPVDSSWAQQAK